MNNRFLLFGAVILMSGVLSRAFYAGDAWKIKPFTQWSESEAKKILTSSPWVKLGDVSFMGLSRMSGRNEGNMAASTGSRGSEGGGFGSPGGGDNPQRNINYELIWFTRVPRQASTRLLQLKQGFSDEQAQQMAEQDKPTNQWKFILKSSAVMGAKPSQAEAIAAESYLIRSDGEKVQAEQIDFSLGPGVLIFLFPMGKAEQPFLTEFTKAFTFLTRIRGASVKEKFKIAECLVGGVLAP